MAYYYRVGTEVLGARMSSPQDREWLERYAKSLGVSPDSIEEFEAAGDPRPPNAPTEPSTPRPPSLEQRIAALETDVEALKQSRVP